MKTKNTKGRKIMLNKEILCEIQESEKAGKEIEREFKELECVVESGTMDMFDVINKLGDLSRREREWRENHRRLLLSAYE
jgi:hypothetical protein